VTIIRSLLMADAVPAELQLVADFALTAVMVDR
jgi:hypothetical protein